MNELYRNTKIGFLRIKDALEKGEIDKAKEYTDDIIDFFNLKDDEVYTVPTRY